MLIRQKLNSTEAQIDRLARLGAIVSANPYYTSGFADKYAQVGLGPERADTMVRAARVLQRGMHLSYHSDLPMAPSAPLHLAWCGVHRITPSGRVAGPEQRIAVDAALRAITIEAAYSWQKEDLLGSIAPGKIANFTVLTQDPDKVPPHRLKEISIWGTVFEGRVFPITGSVPAARNARRWRLGTITAALPPCHTARVTECRDHASLCGGCTLNRALADSGALDHVAAHSVR